jgi:hypothetical protein
MEEERKEREREREKKVSGWERARGRGMRGSVGLERKTESVSMCR